ncbi:uncharacterized protein LOC122658825 isoform X2 [Telopea speciosissima]|nr:uncharacterized protein LOC122658825 isoform X2 [Telopea speciosissima]XP_043709888.1 uncharacterized protein LOC122658825 isoform X2 [Telopea speciosissima]
MALQGDVAKALQVGVSQGFVSNSKGSAQTGNALSSEDAAWVDSCLVYDPELSNSGWDALKDALLDIVNYQSNSHFETMETENGSLSRETPGELLPMIEDEEAGTAPYLEGNDDDLLRASEKVETATYRSYLRSDFLLNPHDPGENCNTDVGIDSWFTNEIHSSSGDIFKVWDLDTPTEEDELVKQLKEALAESSPLSILSAPDVRGTDSNDEALDDLVAGIADLSLHQSSG